LSAVTTDRAPTRSPYSENALGKRTRHEELQAGLRKQRSASRVLLDAVGKALIGACPRRPSARAPDHVDDLAPVCSVEIAPVGLWQQACRTTIVGRQGIQAGQHGGESTPCEAGS
jgi:hypothetical protein